MISLPKWGDHAEKKARYHGIEMYQIAEAWIYGELEMSEAQPGCWRLIGSEVTLVLNADKDFIITLYPNKHNDHEAAERVANCIEIGLTRFEE